VSLTERWTYHKNVSRMSLRMQICILIINNLVVSVYLFFLVEKLLQREKKLLGTGKRILKPFFC